MCIRLEVSRNTRCVTGVFSVAVHNISHHADGEFDASVLAALANQLHAAVSQVFSVLRIQNEPAIMNLTRPQSATEGIEHRFLAPLQVIFAPFSSLSSCNAADLVSAMQGRVRAAVEHLKQVSCSVSHIYPDDAAAEHFPRFWL